MRHPPVMDEEALTAFLAREFPQIFLDGPAYAIEEVGERMARVRFSATERHLRPGGTVSGPALFALADLTAYVAVLSAIGPVPLAVTTDLTIHFLRRAQPGDLLCEARILRLGRRLAVIDCAIRPAAAAELVAHAVTTYALPPNTGTGDVVT